MDTDEAVNADNKEQLQVEETDDSCILDYTEIVPLARDTDGSCTTENINGGWFGEVREVDLKQEPRDVCCVFFYHNKQHLFRSLATVEGCWKCFSYFLIRTMNGIDMTG